MKKNLLAKILSIAAAVLLSNPGARAAGDLDQGRVKARQCAVCHGIDGLAKRPDVPHIAGESDIYLINQLEAFRSGKRLHEIMSIVAADLSDQDIADLVAWYSAIEISVKTPQ